MAFCTSSRRRLPLRGGALAGIGLFLGGCVGLDSDFDATALRQPAMPTIAPAPPEPPPRVVNEDDVFSSALSLAQRNEIPAAMRVVDRVDDRALRLRLGLRVATALAEFDARLAAGLAAALPEGVAQAGAFEIAAVAMTRKDPSDALTWAAGIANPVAAGVVRRRVAGELVRVDALSAVARIEMLPAGQARDDTLCFAAAAWARRDDAAALAWLRERSDGALRQRLTSSIGFEIAQHNPDRALALADTLPAERNRWLLIGAIAQTWVATNPRAALAWARRLPAGESRDAAFSGVETGLGVPVARRRANAPGLRNVGSRGFGGGATVEEAGSAEFAAWRALEAPTLSRDEAMLEYVRQRGASDTGPMGRWLAAQPGGPTRDRAMEIYLDGLLIGSPSAAANWLRSLPRSDRSDEMIEKAAQAWLLTNPEAAVAWLLETNLPPDRKERLLRQAGR